jgi:hypothetical protein
MERTTEIDVPDFWNRQHKTRNKLWLTGSSLGMIDRFHEIDWREVQYVTEIGVGTGSVTSALLGLGLEVSSVDICKLALDRVAEMYTKASFPGVLACYLTEELLTVRPADVVLIHLVAQHCVDDEVSRLIRQPRLRDGGYISLQQSYSKVPLVGPVNPAKMSYHRSIEELRGLALLGGRKITRERNFPDFPRYPTLGWNVVRIENDL